MDVGTIQTLVTNLGFPIIVAIAGGYGLYMMFKVNREDRKEAEEKQREHVSKLNDKHEKHINELNDRHEKQENKMMEVIENNTKVLGELKETIIDSRRIEGEIL